MADEADGRLREVRLELEGLAKAKSLVRVDVSAMPTLTSILGTQQPDAVVAGVVRACLSLGPPYQQAALRLFADTTERWNQTYGARSTTAAADLGIAYGTYRDRKTADGMSHGDHLLERVAGAVLAMEPVEPVSSSSDRGWKAMAGLIGVVAITVFLTGSAPAPGGQAQVLGTRVEGCDIPVAGSTSPSGVPVSLVPIMSETFDGEGGQGGMGCPRHGVEQWRDLWIQAFVGGDQRPPGFLLADLARGSVVWADAGIVSNYQTVVKGDLQSEGGLPDGSEMIAGHHVLHLSKGGLLVAHEPGGPAFWIPGEAVETWIASGGPDGELGLPMTDVRFQDGVPHQDYEHGYIREGEPRQAELHLTSSEDAADYLAELGFPVEGILRSVDGTAWWITDGQRHWIPDTDTWFCLDAPDTVLDSEAPGWVIGSLTSGENATCP